MQIIKQGDMFVPENKFCVMALGCFDGVHIGHRELLLHTVELAKQNGYTPALFTFQSNDDAKSGQRLFSDDENMRRIALCGIETVYTVPFSSVRNLTPRQFVCDILIKKYFTRIAVCGENFRFGVSASGNTDTLCTLMGECGACAYVIKSVMQDEQVVSSTAVRNAVVQGDIAKANRMLTVPYVLCGKVKSGKGLGKKLGTPTANIDINPELIIPKTGVYASCVEFDGKVFPSVTNIGVRPTFENTDRTNCETHIIGYDGQLYGRDIVVSLLGYLRPEKKYSDKIELENQIANDIKEAKKFR